MEHWLILLGVLLPIALLLQLAEHRLDRREPRPAPMPAESRQPQPRG